VTEPDVTGPVAAIGRPVESVRLTTTSPAAESTHAFMFVIATRATESAATRCCAGVAGVDAESTRGRGGVTNVVNCPDAAAGSNVENARTTNV
jgi:hypothetical protein